MPGRDRYYSETLLASAQRTTGSANGSEVRLRDPVAGLVFDLDVTAAAAAGGDTLDVYVQALIAGTWVDIVHFTQVLGNGGAKHYVAKVSFSPAQPEFEIGTALAAATVRALGGDAYRARYTIAGGTGVFTFSVQALPLAAP